MIESEGHIESGNRDLRYVEYDERPYYNLSDPYEGFKVRANSMEGLHAGVFAINQAILAASECDEDLAVADLVDAEGGVLISFPGGETVGVDEENKSENLPWGELKAAILPSIEAEHDRDFNGRNTSVDAILAPAVDAVIEFKAAHPHITNAKLEEFVYKTALAANNPRVAYMNRMGFSTTHDMGRAHRFGAEHVAAEICKQALLARSVAVG
jgi:hypothetical protein